MKVGIVGVGLIGGSLGLALRRRYEIVGLARTPVTIARAKKRRAIHRGGTRARVLSDCDVVVLCVPVHKIAPTLKKILPALKRGAIITDVGSVKEPVARAARAILKRRPDLKFVGGHPIAGSEKTGVENASANLFKKATCVLTSDSASFVALTHLRSLWATAGARCVLMKAADHDRWLALTSHLPHLLAFALFNQVFAHAKQEPLLHALVGGSFRDMTRIAGADAALWEGIISTNKKQLNAALTGFIGNAKKLINQSPASLKRALETIEKDKKSWSK